MPRKHLLHFGGRGAGVVILMRVGSKGTPVGVFWGALFGQIGLEGAELALGSELTLRELRNPARKPDILRDPIPEDIMNMAPHELDEMLFL